MIKIAICDDEMHICTELENAIIQYEHSHSFCLDLDIYYSAKQLLLKFDEGQQYDVIFLDIEMDELNGIELGNRLRYQYGDERTKVIFISWKKQYAMELFNIRPFDFIEKPIDYNRVEKRLQLIHKLLKQENEYFYYSIMNRTEREYYKNILYFESMKRLVIIHSVNGKTTFYSKLKHIESEVNEDTFWLVHKSYLVNCHKIKKFEYHQLTMDNGDVIPISQSRRSIIRAKRLKSWRGKNNA